MDTKVKGALEGAQQLNELQYQLGEYKTKIEQLESQKSEQTSTLKARIAAETQAKQDASKCLPEHFLLNNHLFR